MVPLRPSPSRGWSPPPRPGHFLCTPSLAARSLGGAQSYREWSPRYRPPLDWAGPLPRPFPQEPAVWPVPVGPRVWVPSSGPARPQACWQVGPQVWKPPALSCCLHRAWTWRETPACQPGGERAVWCPRALSCPHRPASCGGAGGWGPGVRPRPDWQGLCLFGLGCVPVPRAVLSRLPGSCCLWVRRRCLCSRGSFPSSVHSDSRPPAGHVAVLSFTARASPTAQPLAACILFLKKIRFCCFQREEGRGREMETSVMSEHHGPTAFCMPPTGAGAATRGVP